MKPSRCLGLGLFPALLLLGCQARQSASPTSVPSTSIPRPAATAPPPRPTAVPTVAAPRPTLPPVPTPVPMPADLASRAPAPLAPGANEPARLVIPRIELDSQVVDVGIRQEGDKLVWDVAAQAVGYHQGTGLPGQPGNVVLSGHISSRYHGNVFHRLPEVGKGDVVVLETHDTHSFVYQVVDTRVVLPTAVEVMDPTPDETLTLITCVPDGIYDHRLVVQAKRVDPDVPPPLALERPD